MLDLETLVNDLMNRSFEEEWFEFKENWYDVNGIGEYISSLSNAAAMQGKDAGYLIWGINDQTHELTNTSFNFRQEVKKEPLEHYLARLITPDIGFSFHELVLKGKRVVVLVIPRAQQVPTSFNNIRYLRIGSSKVNLSKYPERESLLFEILRNGLPSLENQDADDQDLSFKKLFMYYQDKGITLNKDNFEKNLSLRNKNGHYNLLAQLLSDDCHLPIRVSIFRGIDKSSSLYSVREFGYNCLLNSLDKVLEYGDVLNIVQAIEKNRLVERKEVALFNQEAFREALINAFVHNSWIDGNAPMITIYSNRIEILSRGKLPPNQTINGFFLGESVPVNKKLSDIFLQLHISERSGRGVPLITKIYGRDAFEFRENSIVVTIPFNKVEPPLEKNNNSNHDKLNATKKRILNEMEANPKVTQILLMDLIGIGETAIQNNISYLKKEGYIQRIGSNKNGYWKVLKAS